MGCFMEWFTRSYSAENTPPLSELTHDMRLPSGTAPDTLRALGNIHFYALSSTEEGSSGLLKRIDYSPLLLKRILSQHMHRRAAGLPADRFVTHPPPDL